MARSRRPSTIRPRTLTVSEFTKLVSAAFRLHHMVDDLADSLTCAPETTQTLVFSTKRKTSHSKTGPTVDSPSTCPPSISIFPPQSAAEVHHESLPPHILLGMRHERAAKERETQDESISIFSRGRGSCSSYPTDCCPSVYLPSNSPTVDLECTTVVRSPEPDVASSSGVTPTLFLKPRQKKRNPPAEPMGPPSPRPSSKDWTLDLESPLGVRRRPSFTLKPILSTASPDNAPPPKESALRQAAIAPATPPLSPTSPTPDENRTDSPGPLTPDSFTFKFSSHPYSNPYSLSLASKSSLSHPPRVDSSVGLPVPISECLVAKHPSRGTKFNSEWWLDFGDGDALYEDDEDDDMTFYAASASMTSFLNFS